jgi:hypothetical protein
VRTAAEQMKMEMIHGLASVFAGVDDNAIAFAESFLAGNFSGRLEKMAEEFPVLCTRVVKRGKVFAGDDENVDRRLRMNVGECVTHLVLVDGGRGNRSIGDFAEEAGHGATSRAKPVYNREVEHGRCRRLWLD